MTSCRSLIAMCFAFVVAAVPVQSESLGDALRATYHNSGLLDQNRALLRAADEDVAQSLAALRPVVTWQAQAVYSASSAQSSSLSDSIDGTISVSANLLVHDGGASALATEAQKELVPDPSEVDSSRATSAFSHCSGLYGGAPGVRIPGPAAQQRRCD